MNASTEGAVAARALERTRTAWDRIAAGYDAFVTPSGDWALPGEALRRAELGPGMRFLDVAAGLGLTFSGGDANVGQIGVGVTLH